MSYFCTDHSCVCTALLKVCCGDRKREREEISKKWAKKRVGRKEGKQVIVGVCLCKAQNANEYVAACLHRFVMSEFVFKHNRQIMMLMTAHRPVLRGNTGTEAMRMTGLFFF